MTRTLLVAAIAGLAATVALGAFWAAPRVEDDVHDRVSNTLAELPEVSVEVDGRDVRLSGSLPAGVTVDQTLAVVSSIDAVRSVSDDGLTTTDEPPAAAAPVEPSVTVVVSARGAEVSGTVFDGEQLVELLEALQRTAPTVTSRLVVARAEADPGAAGQIEALADLLSTAGTDIGVGTITLTDGRLTVTTTVADDATRGRITGLVEATGLDSSVAVSVAPQVEEDEP